MQTFLLSVNAALLGVITLGGFFAIKHIFGQIDLMREGVNDHYDKVTETLRLFGERIVRQETITSTYPFDVDKRSSR